MKYLLKLDLQDRYVSQSGMADMADMDRWLAMEQPVYLPEMLRFVH